MCIYLNISKRRALNIVYDTHVPSFIVVYYCVISISPWQNFACRWHPMHA